MSGMIDTYKGYVSLQECDEMGHMNIQHYISKSSDSSYNLRVALGHAALDQAESGLGYVALEHHIRFHRELRASDLVVIRSGIVELRDRTMRIYQEMREALDDRLAATPRAGSSGAQLRAGGRRAFPPRGRAHDPAIA